VSCGEWDQGRGRCEALTSAWESKGDLGMHEMWMLNLETCGGLKQGFWVQWVLVLGVGKHDHQGGGHASRTEQKQG